jgi:hypothetical protein
MKKIILLASVSCLLLSSCEKFLDAVPTDQVPGDRFWNVPANVDKYITNLYSESLIAREAVSGIWWDDTMGDDSHIVWNWFVADFMGIARGTANTGTNVSSGMWSRGYANIRRAWMLLENIEKAEGLSPEKRTIYEGEARFFMAWAYNHLINYFGDVPLVTKVLTIEESEAVTRQPKEEVLTFLLGQLDQAITQLAGAPRVYGRVTQAAAQAFKARVLLQQNRWDDVIAATTPLMGKFTLYSEGETPYYDLFHDVVPEADEIILTIPRMAKTGAYNSGTIAGRAFGMKGQTGGDPYRSLTPTGPLVDSYPMANGRLPKEEGSGYDKTNPHAKRDPRFYQSITYPGGEIETVSGGEIVMKPYDPENAATTNAMQLYDANEPSATGYAWRKFMDYSVYGMSNLTDCVNDIMLIRYAEVLLMRAEALAESKGPEAKEEIINLVDQLRDRVKGGKVTRENYNSKEDLIKLVRNERRIELCGEGLRPWDLKRWKVAELNVVENGYGLTGDLYGAYMRMDGVGSTMRTVMVDGVHRRWVEERKFNPARDYLLPIPQSQIDLNPNLTQNPGW